MSGAVVRNEEVDSRVGLRMASRSSFLSDDLETHPELGR